MPSSYLNAEQLLGGYENFKFNVYALAMFDVDVMSTPVHYHLR